MQVLSSVSIQDVRIGDRVKSMLTGSEGFVYKIIPIEKARRYEDTEFVIKWENGNVSQQWHFMLDGVWMM